MICAQRTVCWHDGLASADGVVAGVDEAGRGPLAGPVVAAAVILPDNFSALDQIDDSKRLSPEHRSRRMRLLRREAQVATASAAVAEIERFNIRGATLVAMKRAVCRLKIVPDRVLVDGDPLGAFDRPAEFIVKGDSRVANIAAASIAAKVSRDRLMLRLHSRYPCYGFDRHKGYPTPQHIAALRRYGPCPAHRRSFGPVRHVIEEQN